MDFFYDNLCHYKDKKKADALNKNNIMFTEEAIQKAVADFNENNKDSNLHYDKDRKTVFINTSMKDLIKPDDKNS